MLSIIIPALNEEQRLPLLLESIKRQNFSGGYEVIVADAGSKDRTVEIARSYGCKVVPGGLPAKGRNEGAKVARGDLFLFVDGDSVLPDNFLRGNIKEFRENKLDVASVSLYPDSMNPFGIFLCDLFYNWPARATETFLPHATNTILVKKTLHRQMGGFDETIRLAEDHAYARDGAELGKFRMLRSAPLLVTTKRFARDGWAKTYCKCLLCELYTIYIGPVRSDIFRYRFGHWDEKKKGPGKVVGTLLIPFKIVWTAIEVAFVVLATVIVSALSIIGLVGKFVRSRLQEERRLRESREK